MYIPPEIRVLIEGSQCDSVHTGKSAASVFRLRSYAGTLFLKIGPVTDNDGLEAEAERLRWLVGRLSVPKVVSFAQVDGREYLLMTSVSGVNGVEAGRDHPAGVVTGLAQALRMLHEQPIDACPFDQTVAVQMERARRRVAAGMVDEADFDEERVGRTAQKLLADVDAWQPADEARNLTHGDPCLPNVMFENGQFAGFVDCGRFGVADPYQDLALAARSISSNLGREWVEVFFMRYGVSTPDERKLAFYQLLDEFF